MVLVQVGFECVEQGVGNVQVVLCVEFVYVGWVGYVDFGQVIVDYVQVDEVYVMMFYFWVNLVGDLVVMFVQWVFFVMVVGCQVVVEFVILGNVCQVVIDWFVVDQQDVFVVGGDVGNEFLGQCQFVVVVGQGFQDYVQVWIVLVVVEN